MLLEKLINIYQRFLMIIFDYFIYSSIFTINSIFFEMIEFEYLFKYYVYYKYFMKLKF